MARTSTMPTPIQIGADDVLLDGAVALSTPLPDCMGVVGDGRAATDAANGATAVGGGGITLCTIVGGRDDCATAFVGTAGVVTEGGGAGGIALGGICGGGGGNGCGGGGVGDGGGMVCRVLDEEKGT